MEATEENTPKVVLDRSENEGFAVRFAPVPFMSVPAIPEFAAEFEHQ